MHFFRDGGVSSVLTKTPGAFLDSFAARRAKTKDGFCPILMYCIYTAVLCAVLPCPHEKITIFRGALMYFLLRCYLFFTINGVFH
jgi:hypothetical protein